MLHTSERPSLRNFKKIAAGIRLDVLRDELSRNESAWKISTTRQDKIKCQRETASIFLRTADTGDGALKVEDIHAVKDAIAAPMFPSTLAWLRSTGGVLGGELDRVLFASLQPNGRVYRHVDAGKYYACRRRYHLIVNSAEGSPMVCGDEEIVMREGELWEFDNKQPHEAFNHASTPRVHLIFDLYHGDAAKL